MRRTRNIDGGDLAIIVLGGAAAGILLGVVAPVVGIDVTENRLFAVAGGLIVVIFVVVGLWLRRSRSRSP